MPREALDMAVPMSSRRFGKLVRESIAERLSQGCSFLRDLKPRPIPDPPSGVGLPDAGEVA